MTLPAAARAERPAVRRGNAVCCQQQQARRTVAACGCAGPTGQHGFSAAGDACVARAQPPPIWQASLTWQPPLTWQAPLV